MDIQLKVGIKGQLEEKVIFENTAAKLGSGLVEVYATPAMITLMEKTAMQSILPHLPPGFNSVGTEINVKHLKASGLGLTIRCVSELVEINGRQLVFKVIANDDDGEIGYGTHIRFIIETDRFMAKIKKKV